MQNRTHDITRQYWILNDQYRLLNTTIINALENHDKVKIDFEKNVRKKFCAFVRKIFELFLRMLCKIRIQLKIKLMPN
jgi:hypothetical protein